VAFPTNPVNGQTTVQGGRQYVFVVAFTNSQNGWFLTGAAIADLNLNGHKIINLAPGTNPSDAVNLAQMEDEVAVAIEIESRLSKLEQQNQQQAQQIHHLNHEVGELKGRVNTLESEVETLDGKVAILEGKVDVLEGRVNTLESDLSSLDYRVDTLEGKVNDLDHDLDLLLKRLAATHWDNGYSLWDEPIIAWR